MATISNRKLQKTLVLPISQLFRHYTNKEVLELWLVDRTQTRLIGVIRGFDEYMNIVLGNAEECTIKKNPAGTGNNEFYDVRKPLGTILLKGENIALISPVSAQEQS